LGTPRYFHRQTFVREFIDDNEHAQPYFITNSIQDDVMGSNMIAIQWAKSSGVLSTPHSFTAEFPRARRRTNSD
jgi:hypothetical protein